MPTQSGWCLATAVVALAVAGRLLGAVELVAVAVAGAALLIAAVAYVRLARVTVEVQRDLRPPRRHAGVPGDVEITIRNTAPRPSPTLTVHDPFDPSGTSLAADERRARFRVAPLRPGQAVRATYQLPGEDRGVYELGPLEVRLEDPFGLASMVVAVAPVARLVVYPRIEPLGPLSPGLGGRRQRQSPPVTRAVDTDGDLYTLREYHMGDDLRRVHWRSTAKHDEVMIRHDDVPAQSTATVVLDLRHEVHSPDTLESALSAAASIVHAAWRLRWPVRLVASDGTDSGLAAGHAHVQAILEGLARAQAHDGPARATAAAQPPNRSGAGMVAVITTGAASDADFSGITRQPGPKVLLLVGGPGARPGVRRPGDDVRTVRVGAGRSLSSPWAAAMGTGRHPATARS